MIKLFISIITLSIIACSNHQATSDARVFDYASELTTSQIDSLQLLIAAHEHKTSNQIAIVTSTDLEGYENEVLYATEIGNRLGVGQKDKDNGLVILYCGPYRKTAIATGRGTEKVLRDEIAAQIIDSVMIPRFKEGNAFSGLYNGTVEVIRFLETPGNEIE